MYCVVFWCYGTYPKSACFFADEEVGNGVLTAPWVMSALADRFLFIASLLPKDVYCRFRSKLSTYSGTFPQLNSTKHAYASLPSSTRCRRSYISCSYCLASRRLISQPLSLRECPWSSSHYFENDSKVIMQR
jgi:hypothetical protein